MLPHVPKRIKERMRGKIAGAKDEVFSDEESVLCGIHVGFA